MSAKRILQNDSIVIHLPLESQFGVAIGGGIREGDALSPAGPSAILRLYQGRTGMMVEDGLRGKECYPLYDIN